MKIGRRFYKLITWIVAPKEFPNHFKLIENKK
jgi:hypothetical protein